MSGAVQSLQGVPRRNWAVIFFAFILFTVAFLGLYQRHASISGSWKFLINDRDDYQFWSITKGTTHTPTDDGNPYYFEEKGRTNTLPYTSPQIIGTLAKIFGIPVLSFFPVWHIGLPFISWLVMTLALCRFWKYSFMKSAVITLAVMAVLLNLRSTAQGSFYRYSRPGDALCFLFFWLSYVFNPVKSRLLQAGTLVSVFITTAMNPMIALMGCLATTQELLWQKWVSKNEEKARLLMLVFAAAFVSGLLYTGYVALHFSKNPWWFTMFANEKKFVGQMADTMRRQYVRPEWPSIVWFCALCAALGWSRFKQKCWTAFDRLIFLVFFMRLFFSNLQLLFSANFQMAQHVYYFIPIEFFCLLAWLNEKMPAVARSPFFLKTEKFLFPAVGFAAFAVLFTPVSFFIWNLNFLDPSNYRVIDEAVLYFSMTPMIVFILAACCRFESIKRELLNRKTLACFIAGALISGYWAYPIPNRPYLQNFPFARAYAWLNENAQKDEVVLSAPHNRTFTDYLILYTDLKTFISPYGEYMSKRKQNPNNIFRFTLYTNLLYGSLDKVQFQDLKTKEEKLSHLKLNYVLLERDTPFAENVQRELSGYVKQVYGDQRCLLYKIVLPPQSLKS